MTERNYAQEADTLVQAFALRDYHAEHFQNDKGGTVDAVNVWADPGDRYPCHSVWIDADGYTWGKSYEFNRPWPIGPADVAQAVIKTFKDGIR